MRVMEDRNSHFCDQPSTIQFRSVHIVNRNTTNHSFDPVAVTDNPVLQLTESTMAIVVYVLPSRYLVFRVSLQVPGTPTKIVDLLQYIACVRLHVSSISHGKYKNGIGLFRNLNDPRIPNIKFPCQDAPDDGEQNEQCSTQAIVPSTTQTKIPSQDAPDDGEQNERCSTQTIVPSTTQTKIPSQDMYEHSSGRDSETHSAVIFAHRSTPIRAHKKRKKPPYIAWHTILNQPQQ